MEKLELFCWAVLFWSITISSAQSRLVVGDSQFRYVDPFGSLLLNCSTPDNSPVGCRVGWLQGAGSRVLNDSHHTVYCNGSLKIRNVTGPLVGVDRRYRCYDIRGNFEDSRSIFVELRNFPTPIVSDVLVVEGRDTSLTCNVDGARPHPSEIKWYHNGTLVKNERFSELPFTNVNRSQSGNYTCVVRIDDDTASGSGILTVAYIDITNTTPIVITALVNTSSNIRFGCQASGIPMVTTIMWIYPLDVTFLQHPLSVSPDNTRVTGYGDVVSRIEYKHSGWYMCSVTNNVTRNSIVFTLLVKGPPAPPYKLMLLSISAYEAQVGWKVPFDGHDPITLYFVFVRSNIDNFTITTDTHTSILRQLQPNTRYQYLVIAQNGYGNGTNSDDGEFTTLSLSPPSPPSNVHVTVLNSTAVNVSWEIPLFNSSVGTILYTSIQYNRRDNSVVTKRSSNRQHFTNEWTVHNATSVVIRGLAKGTAYAFIVCLGNKEGKGPCEEVYEITPKTVPSVPVVEVVVVSSYSVQISWSVRDDGGNTDLLYTLTRWTGDNNPVVLLSVSVSDDGRYLADHLLPNTSYQFSVVAHSDSGDSAEGWSMYVVTNPLPPGIPTSLTVVGNVVRWLPSNVAGNNTGTAAFYFVQFAPFDFPSSTNMIETLEVTVDLTGHVMPGSRYRVRVRAGNTGGLSNWSDPVMFAAVNQPPNPAVGSASSSHDRDKIVIAVVCTSVSVVVIIVIMIVIFCVLYHKRQTILHTYKINSIDELDDIEQEGNTYKMITDNDKPHPSNDQTSLELNEQDVEKNSLYQIDTRAGDIQMATMTIDDRSKTPSPLMILPVRIALSTDTTDV